MTQNGQNVSDKNYDKLTPLQPVDDQPPLIQLHRQSNNRNSNKRNNNILIGRILFGFDPLLRSRYRFGYIDAALGYWLFARLRR